jgi:hypothetical protein
VTDYGTAGLEDLTAALRSRRSRAWITAVTSPATAGKAPLLYAQITIGPRDKSWRDETWVFGTCTFTRASLSAARVGSLFAGGGSKNVALGSMAVTFELPETNFSWRRQASLAEYGGLALPIPSINYAVPLVGREMMQPPSGFLVGDGEAPSFPSFASAFNAFFFGDYSVSGSRNTQLGELSVHLEDLRARITRVRIRSASLEVWVGGRAARGVRLELNGSSHRASVVVTKSGRVVLPLPEGLPADAWLWLKLGTEWLDFRSLCGWGGRLSPDVDLALPKDPVSDLTELVSRGEGAQLEYKQKLPDTPGEKRTVFKTVVAFANGSGGTVVFGVGDGGEIVGIEGDLQRARRRLTDLVRDVVTPPLSARVDTVTLDGRHLFVLKVPVASGVLHALTIDANKPEYYVRRDATTFYARPEELAAIIAGRGPRNS